MKDEERLRTAQWILERNLGWVAAAEVKVAVVVTIDVAMLGALAAAFAASKPEARTAWAYLTTVLSGSTGALGVFCAAMSVLPRVNGPDSLIFFGKIARHKSADFETAFQKATTASMLSDCLAQIHRNAEIARDKFSWVRVAMAWSFASVTPWIAALTLLIKQ